MTILFNESLVVFLKFLQVLLWICIPALSIGMLVTTIAHYKNKKKKKQREQFFLLDGAKVFSGYDDASLIPADFYLHADKAEVKKIMHQLFQSNAKYIAIRKDYDLLNEKFLQLNKQQYQPLKYETMETLHTSAAELDNIRIQYENERKELLSELEQLTASYENLEKDNASLREQVEAHSNDGTNVSVVIEKWEQEKSDLKKKINEHEYLKDVLEEKKMQITFLQQQLEQRIKNHHLVEQQFRDLGIKFMETKEELEIKQQSCKEFESSLNDKEVEIIFLKEVLQAKTEHESQMETLVKTLKEQNESVSALLLDNNSLIQTLREQLASSDEKKVELERRLEKNQTYFKGLHRKLADILEEESTESPVIVMKQVFGQEENKLSETAAQ